MVMVRLTNQRRPSVLEGNDGSKAFLDAAAAEVDHDVFGTWRQKDNH
jgi:hypothetical protein